MDFQKHIIGYFLLFGYDKKIYFSFSCFQPGATIFLLCHFPFSLESSFLWESVKVSRACHGVCVPKQIAPQTLFLPVLSIPEQDDGDEVASCLLLVF